MRRHVKLIDALIEEIEKRGAVLHRMNQKDLDIIFSVCQEKECIIWLTDNIKIEPVFVNNYAATYYGYSSNDLSSKGFELYTKLMHPDFITGLHKSVSFWVNTPKDVHETTFRVKHHSGEWRWTYSISRALSFTKEGIGHHIISAVFDVEESVFNKHEPSAAIATTHPFILKNKHLYDSLSKREIEILNLIADDKTSAEIAKTLGIEISTVGSHRKRIIKKLGVKSSFGLVKYAVHFNNSYNITHI